MARTTTEASYIIVLGIVISVVPISSTLLQDSYHIHFKQNSKHKRRGANQTLSISLKQMCPTNLHSNSISDAISNSTSNTISVTISEHTKGISEAISNSNF